MSRPVLTRLRNLLIVDTTNGRMFWKHPPKQHPRLRGKEAGSPVPNRKKVYWAIQIDGKKYKRGQLVFYLTRGRWPSPQVDHIDGNALNDRPDNLRAATQMQNAWNHKRRTKASPLPMGVRQAQSGRYVARIRVNNKRITIGTFRTVDAAALAYQFARKKHFGEFA